MSKDPFAPPDHHDRKIELNDHRPTPSQVEITQMELPAFPLPEQRKPVNYKAPKSSMLTLIVLVFAGIGAVGVGTVVMKNFMNKKPALPGTVAGPVEAPKPVTYKPVEKGDVVLITVEVTPRDARLQLDGEPLPSNPAHVTRGPHRLTASADGYELAEQQFTADDAKTLKFKLKKAK